MPICYVKQFNVMVRLASLGTTPAILNRYPVHASRKIVEQAKAPAPYDHRNFSGWTRKANGRIIAERILGIFIRFYAQENSPEAARAVFKREPDEFKLLDVYDVYTSIYPKDEITTNRIYFLAGHIRNKEIIINPVGCSCCKKVFLHHMSDNHSLCAVCTESKKSALRSKLEEENLKSETDSQLIDNPLKKVD